MLPQPASRVYRTCSILSYLPDGYTAYDQPGEWTVSHENDGDGVSATISYNNQAADGHISIIEEMYRQGEPNAVLNRPEKQDVTVRGQPGIWMPAGGKSVLTWDENGITYRIITSLPKDEVLKVAKSLGK
jgi:hypothetical protein